MQAMQKIADSNGTPIKGFLRSPVGAIVVNDQDAFNKYKRERELELKVANQEQQIQEIH